MLSSVIICSSLRPSSRHLSSFVPALCRYYSAPTPRPLLGRFDYVPVDLARVQSGQNVRVRDYEQQKALKRFSYDLKLSSDGLVMPAKGENFIGTPLPEALTILHEHSDHYSLQCTQPMTLDKLNTELTKFINAHGRQLDKQQFDEEYPFTI